METHSFTVQPEQEGMRPDVFLAASFSELSRSSAVKLCEIGGVKIGGTVIKKNRKLRAGECVTVTLPEPVLLDVVAQEIPLDIIYEDDAVLVVNKPSGMVVHPAAGNYTGTLVNALMHYCPDELSPINGVMRPGIVHRLDKQTSGLLLVAKTAAAHIAIAGQLADHSCKRLYLAVAEGRFKHSEGVWDRPIGRHRVNRKLMSVITDSPKSAVTHYKVLTEYERYSYAEFRLETGRTHQIRVHAAASGHPIAGDPVYGKPHKDLPGGQCLHAARVGFVHPNTGEYKEFFAPPPEEFLNFMEKLT